MINDKFILEIDVTYRKLSADNLDKERYTEFVLTKLLNQIFSLTLQNK